MAYRIYAISIIKLKGSDFKIDNLFGIIMLESTATDNSFPLWHRSLSDVLGFFLFAFYPGSSVYYPFMVIIH